MKAVHQPSDETLDEFLDRIRTQDVRLEPSGDGRLRFDAPEQAVTDELLAQLRRRRGGLLARLGAGNGAGRTSEVVASEVVSLQQGGLVAYHRTAPLPQVMNVGTKMTMTGQLDPVALETALAALVGRHEGLRTRFVPDGDGWRQEVLAPLARALPVEDLSDLDEAACNARVEEICRAEVNEPFDLEHSTEPRFRLLRLAPDRWVLTNIVHHVSTDGWSFTVQQREIAALYRAALAGSPDDLQQVRAQPRHYARWQHDEQLDQATEERRLAYWRRTLDGCAFRLELPADRPRVEPPTAHGRTAAHSMPGSSRAAVEALARARRTTPFAVTTAAAAILLAQLTGQRDLLMQVPYANRDQQVFESTLTCTVMNLALRLRLDQASTFAELVDQTSQAARAAIDNLLPLGRILTNLTEHGVPDVPERILVIVLHQNSIELAIDMPGLHVKTEDLPADAARAELTFGVAPRPDPRDGYRVFAEHPLDRWDAETVDGWMHTYADIVARACASPDIPLEQLQSDHAQ